MKWKTAVDEEAAETATKFEGEVDGLVFEDMNYGLEEMDGSYKTVDGLLVMKKPRRAPAVKKDTKKNNKKKDTREKKQKTKKEEPPPPPPLTEEEEEAQRRAEQARMAAEAFAEAEEEEEAAQEVDLPEWDALSLHPLLVRALHKLGFERPSAIQKLCIPVILSKGKDVLGVSETGSGKTLAYGLPILSRLIADKEENAASTAVSGVQCLVVAPTRELAMQVTEHLRAVLQMVPLQFRPRAESLVGGISEDKQERLLANKPELVVCTMGRLKSFLVDRPNAHLRNLKQSLKFLVLDEADRLSDPMHAHDLQPLLDVLVDVNKSTNKQRQTLLFSATLLNVEDSLGKGKGAGILGMDSSSSKQQNRRAPTSGPLMLMDKLGRRGKPEVCEVSKDGGGGGGSAPAAGSAPAGAAGASTDGKTATGLQQPAAPRFTLPDSISLSLVECTDEDKEAWLHYVVASMLPKCRSILVFVNTINATHRLGSTLQLDFPQLVVGSLHANMDQTQRLRNLDKFKKKPNTANGEEDKKRLLVCSDVAARGLDVPTVDLVVHYGMPSRVDTFVHRSGRCGRAGRTGTVVALASGLEVQRTGKIRNALAPRKMEPFVGGSISSGDGGKGPAITTKTMFARFQVCKKLYLLESAHKGKSQSDNWRKRTAKEAELGMSDDDDDDGAAGGFDSGEVAGRRRERGALAEEAQDRAAKVHADIAKLRNELNRMLAGVSLTQAGQHRRGRKRVQH